MENNKILDLSELTDEAVNEIKGAIEFMKTSPFPGKVTFIADSEEELTKKALNGALGSVYGEGICDAVIGGSIGLLATLAVGYFRHKRKKWIK